jgi:hypothetical protein
MRTELWAFALVTEVVNTSAADESATPLDVLAAGAPDPNAQPDSSPAAINEARANLREGTASPGRGRCGA